MLGEDDESLARSSSNLAHAKRSLKDILAAGEDVQTQLAHQRETIATAGGKLDETRALSGEARSILRGLERTERRQRIFLYAVICAVVVGVAIVAYYMLFS